MGLKNVTMNEPFFRDISPGGILSCRGGSTGGSFSSGGGAVALLAQPEYRNRLVLFAGIDKFRFREVVRPGDQLIMELEVLKMRGGGAGGKAQGKITVDDKVVADGADYVCGYGTMTGFGGVGVDRKNAG